MIDELEGYSPEFRKLVEDSITCIASVLQEFGLRRVDGEFAAWKIIDKLIDNNIMLNRCAKEDDE